MSDITGYNSISIVGLGLIGGSIALKLKQALPNCKINAYDLNQQTLEQALATKAIDKISLSIEDLCKNSDLIIIASNLHSYPLLADIVTDNISAHTIVTDVGSVKQYAIDIFENIDQQFVPAHPIAGKETSGFISATSQLFNNKKVIITPTNITDPDKTDKVIKLWQLLGASCEVMTALEHDKIFAHLSHLPQALIFCESNITKHQQNNPILKQHLRLAISNKQMWYEIFQANKEFIKPLLNEVIEQLPNLTHADILNAQKIRSNLNSDVLVNSSLELPQISYLIAAILVKLSYKIEYAGSGFLDSTACLLNYSKWQESKNMNEMISEIKILMANL